MRRHRARLLLERRPADALLQGRPRPPGLLRGARRAARGARPGPERRTATTPNFAWVAPDDCTDMEGCGIAAGDAFLKTELTQIMNSPAWRTQRSLAIITFDEDATDGQRPAQRVPTLVLASQGVRPGYTDPTRYTHYSMLRTVEAALGLGTLTANDRVRPRVQRDIQNQQNPCSRTDRWLRALRPCSEPGGASGGPGQRARRPGPADPWRESPPTRPDVTRPRQPRSFWRRRPRPASRSAGSPTTARPRSARLT